jgi:hypothetical protein
VLANTLDQARDGTPDNALADAFLCDELHDHTPQATPRRKRLKVLRDWADSPQRRLQSLSPENLADLERLRRLYPDLPKFTLASFLKKCPYLPTEDFREGWLLPLELDEMLRSLKFERQQQLFDAHLHVSAALERLLRVTFKQLGFVPKNPRRIDIALCEWVATQDGKIHGESHQLDNRIYSEIIKPVLAAECLATPPDRLAIRLSKAVIEACGKGIGATHLRELLCMGSPDSGTRAWNSALLSALQPSTEGFGDALLAGKLLIAVRNFLTHAHVDDKQPIAEDEVYAWNQEMQIRLCLDGVSLGCVFRLLVAVSSFVVYQAKLFDGSEAD